MQFQTDRGGGGCKTYQRYQETNKTQHQTPDAADEILAARRRFLARCGSFAAATPPAVTLLLSTAQGNYAAAQSAISQGGGGGGTGGGTSFAGGGGGGGGFGGSGGSGGFAATGGNTALASGGHGVPSDPNQCVVVVSNGKYSYACPTGMLPPDGPPPELQALNTITNGG